MKINKSTNQQIKNYKIMEWKIIKLVKKGGTWTFIVAIGGAIYKFVGPNLNVFIDWIRAFLGIL